MYHNCVSCQPLAEVTKYIHSVSSLLQVLMVPLVLNFASSAVLGFVRHSCDASPLNSNARSRTPLLVSTSSARAFAMAPPENQARLK